MVDEAPEDIDDDDDEIFVCKHKIFASLVEGAPEGLNVETGVVAGLQQVQSLRGGVDYLQLVREEGPPDFKLSLSKTG